MKVGEIMEPVPTVAVMTVLSVELQAIISALEIGKNKVIRKAADQNIYFETMIQSKLHDFRFKVVIHHLSKPGNEIASTQAKWLIDTFSPSCLILTGISAGIKGKVKIGDVVWSRNVINGVMSVATKGKTRPRPEIHYLPRIMSEMLHSLHDVQKAHSRLVLAKYKTLPRPHGEFEAEEVIKNISYPPKIHDASIYSSNALIRDPRVLLQIRDMIDDQVKAAEMEAGGVVSVCCEKMVPWLVIRSISDFGDDFKSDKFHEYASASAAFFLRYFLTHGLDWACLLNKELRGKNTDFKKKLFERTKTKTVGFRLASKPLFGRERDVGSLIEYSKTSSIAIRGMKGIGKSKVLSALVEGIIEDDPKRFEWCYWVRFEIGVPMSFSVFAKNLIKDITGVELNNSDSGQEQLAASVVEILRSNKCLLIIDQFESVIDRTTRCPIEKGYSYLLRSARAGLEPGCLIVTSWETPIDCEGVEFPDWELKGLNEDASLNLLEYAMRKNKKENEVSDSLQSGRIVKLLGGHPFAIELLSTNYRFVLMPSILQQDHSGKSIEEISAIVVRYLYDSIPFSSAALNILDVIAISKTPLKLSALEAVTGLTGSDLSFGLQELCTRSFVYLIGDCYDAHTLVRQYVLSRQSSEKKSKIHREFARMYFKNDEADLGKRLSERLEVLVIAMRHLIDAESFGEALDLFLEKEMDLKLYNRGDHDRLWEFIGLFLSRNPKKYQESKLLMQLARLNRDRDLIESAVEHAENALNIARSLNDNELLVEALVNAGDIQYYCGRSPKAKEYLMESIEKKTSSTPLYLVARSFGCMGNAEADSKQKIKWYQDAIKLAVEAGDQRYAGIWKGDLALQYLKLGEEEVAEQYFLEAIDHAKYAEDPMHYCFWLGSLAKLHWKRNSSEIAVQYFCESIEKSINSGYTRIAKMVLDWICELHKPEEIVNPVVLILSQIRFPAGDQKRFSWLAEKLTSILGERAIDFRAKLEFENAIAEYTKYCAIPLLEPFLLGERALCYRILAYTSNEASALLGKAADDYRRAHALMPDRDSYLFNLACTLSQSGIYSKALEILENLLNKNPHYSSALLTRAEIKLLLQKPEEAYESTDKVVRSAQSGSIRCIGLYLQCLIKNSLKKSFAVELDELNKMNVKLSVHKDWCLVESKAFLENSKTFCGKPEHEMNLKIFGVFKSKFIDHY